MQSKSEQQTYNYNRPGITDQDVALQLPIVDINSLRIVLMLLAPQQCAERLKNFHKLPLIVRSIFDITAVLRNLPVENGKVFIQHLGKFKKTRRFKRLNKEWLDCVSLAFALRDLSPAQCKLVLDEFDIRPKIIHNQPGLADLITWVNAELHAPLVKILGPKLLPVFKEGDKLLQFLNDLPVRERKPFFESFCDTLETICQGNYSHEKTFTTFNHQQRALIFRVMLDITVPLVIRSPMDFMDIFKTLPPSLDEDSLDKIDHEFYQTLYKEEAINLLWSEPEKINISRQQEKNIVPELPDLYTFFSHLRKPSPIPLQEQEELSEMPDLYFTKDERSSNGNVI
ncbi:MAG: hypothetical protein H2069_01030 [Legionella sp.]|nr:hypothetical protein [Legionella sp.]